MKHYGPEPPWRGRTRHYGSWHWVGPSVDSWFDEPGYWEWRAPLSGIGLISGVLADYYLPALQRELNREMSFLTEWRVQQQEPLLVVPVEGTPLPRSAAAESAYEHERFGGVQHEWYDR